jgi:release factor glutamine methyltransferase
MYPGTESAAFLDMIFEEYFSLGRVKRLLNPGYRLTESEMLKVHFAVKQLKKHEPIQYILGRANFFGLDFIVNQHVLIPRPETEELVQWIIDDVGLEKANQSILDIGTGSGCIAIALKKALPSAKISAIDISGEALGVARQNSVNNDTEVHFMQEDIFKLDDFGQDNNFDIIASNPPYVRESEKKEMAKNVLAYEPEQALYVNDSNPLVYYRRIADLAFESLNPNGKLFLEINQYLGHETVELLKMSGFTDVELRKDLNDKHRMIRAVLAY